jgi:hypothetical protein
MEILALLALVFALGLACGYGFVSISLVRAIAALAN